MSRLASEYEICVCECNHTEFWEIWSIHNMPSPYMQDSLLIISPAQCAHSYVPLNPPFAAQGPAWFDEAEADGSAHALAECSNRGLCDRDTGTCVCHKGFTGDSCQVGQHPATSAAHLDVGRYSHYQGFISQVVILPFIQCCLHKKHAHEQQDLLLNSSLRLRR